MMMKSLLLRSVMMMTEKILYIIAQQQDAPP
jgi:hypothetical protein